MASRFNPLAALEGSFLGFPFKISRERGQGGRRGPLHEYPDRDLPYFEDLGRKAKEFDLAIYFVGDAADVTAQLFEALLQKGRAGSLILPGLRRERMVARSWSYDRDSGKGNWVAMQVGFVEAGGNQFPTSSDSWPHRLIDAALDARTAFADALGEGLSVLDLSQEVTEQLAGSAGLLAVTLDGVAQVASGLAPSTAIAAAGLLTAGYAGDWAGVRDGVPIDTVLFAAATASLLAGWADALVGTTPTNESRQRAVDGLFGVYDVSAESSWYVPGTQTELQAVQISNQAAYSAGIRRLALTEAARISASLVFASYDDAARLRERFADAFDVEIDQAASAPSPRLALTDLAATTLRAISEGGADKARLVPYAIARPRPALALSQYWYGDQGGIAARAAELTARTGAIHPAFLPASGERLSR